MSDLTSTQSSISLGIFSAVAVPFRWMADFLEVFRVALQQSHAYEELSRLSDAQLERRGLKREDIVRHVFFETH
jgi:hypothetical protein